MKSLRSKLSITLLGSMLVGSVLTGFLVIRSQTAILTRQLSEDGQTLARTIANNSVEQILVEDYAILRGQIEQTGLGNPLIVYIRLYDDSNRLRVGYPRKAERPSTTFDSPEIIVYDSPIIVSVDDLPAEKRGRVEVGLKNERFVELTAASINQMLAGTAASFSILAVVLWLFLRRQVLRRLHALDHDVSVIADGDLNHPVQLDGSDEIGRLGSALEAMRSNLKASYSRIEEQVFQLRDVDRMKDEFLANTSHELKTPLNGILGISESLLLGSYGEIREDQEEAVEIIASCANRLWKMTESILKFSRLHRDDSGIHTIAEEHFLADHLGEALADLRATAEKSGVRFIVTIPKDFQAVYLRDELEQVIRVLVDNAIKYAPGGVVQVAAKRWDRTGRRGFQVAVRDNGPGIPPELHEKIFEPFIQGFGHETRTQGGVGLGLAIASKLTQRMGSKIVLDSDVGKGATFSVLVPEDQGPAEDLASAYEPWPAFNDSVHLWTEKQLAQPPIVTTEPERAQERSACHILVVDDEEVNREVVWQALRGAYRVTRVSSGEVAMEVLRKQPTDLVLLDIMMPGMSGYGVLKMMRAEGILERVPVIVLSAKTSRDAVVKGLELGASDYLGKPFHRAELLCRVRVHLELKRQRDQLRAEVSAKSNALELAEHAARVKSQFLANMSHEIRTPLNSILGFLELAKETEAGEEQKEFLGIVEERTHALLGIVNEIFDLTKIESRDVQLSIAPCELRGLIAAAGNRHAPAAKRKGLDFSLESQLPGESWVETDARKVEQILDCLLDNAVKFTSAGSVRLAARLEPGGSGESSILTLEVIDTGIGVPPQKSGVIFEPFSQADPSPTRRFGGAGLGLAIARAYARMLGGDIVLDPAPALPGSCFRCRLKVKPTQPNNTPIPVLTGTEAAPVEAGR